MTGEYDVIVLGAGPCMPSGALRYASCRRDLERYSASWPRDRPAVGIRSAPEGRSPGNLRQRI